MRKKPNEERLKSPIYIEFDGQDVRAFSSRNVTKIVTKVMKASGAETVQEPLFYCHYCPDPPPTFKSEEEWKIHQRKHWKKLPHSEDMKCPKCKLVAWTG